MPSKKSFLLGTNNNKENKYCKEKGAWLEESQQKYFLFYLASSCSFFQVYTTFSMQFSQMFILKKCCMLSKLKYSYDVILNFVYWAKNNC